MRIERDYQAMFHPLKNLEEGQGKKKPIGKAAALWICTLGVYPLVAGLTHLIKKGLDQHRAKKLQPNELNPDAKKASHLSKSRLGQTGSVSSRGSSASPSNSYFEQEEGQVKPSLDAQSTAPSRPQDEEVVRLSKRLSEASSESSPSNSYAEQDVDQATPSVNALSTAPSRPQGVTPQITPDEMSKAWKEKMIPVRNNAAAGDVNAKFQMLVWQLEGRDIGEVDLIPHYKKIVLEACKAKNPEALILRIKNLYTKRSDQGANTKKIDNEIAFLRRWLERLKGPEAEAAQAELWNLGKDAKDKEKLAKLVTQ